MSQSLPPENSLVSDPDTYALLQQGSNIQK